MKHIITSLFLLFTYLFSTASSIIALPSGYISDNTIDITPVRTVEEAPDGIIVTYTFSGIGIADTYDDTKKLVLPGFGVNNTPGDPAIIAKTDSHILPEGKTSVINVLDCEFTDVEFELSSSSFARPEKDSIPHYNGTPIIPYEGFKPMSPIKRLNDGDYRGKTLIRVEINPTLYNYQTKTLRIYSQIRYKIVYQNSISTRSSAMTEIGSWLETTPATIKKQSNTYNEEKTSLSANAGYLIITVPKYVETLSEFAKWKRMLGYDVNIVSDYNWTPQKIRQAVKDEYSRNESLMHLLLVGTNNDVPGQLIPGKKAYELYKNTFYPMSDSIVLNEHITDFYYGCLGDNNDQIPEIYRGRWPVWDISDLETVINKTMWYEQQPTADPLFYKKGAHCSYFHQHSFDPYSEDYRFVETSEDTRNYMQIHQKKDIERIYWADREIKGLYPKLWNHFGYGSGDSIPDELANHFDWDAMSFANLAPAINDGRLYVLYRGHGDKNRLITHLRTNYSFSRPEIRTLDNTEWQPLFFSICCSTGDYTGECLADMLLTRVGGGTMAVFAASNISYSGYNDALTCAFFNTIWPTPGYSIPMDHFSIDRVTTPTYQLGAILDLATQRGLGCYSASDSVVIYTKELFHLFGDPSLYFNTEIPTEYNTVMVDSTSSSISVDLGYDEGYIGFYDQVTNISSRFYGNNATFSTNNPEYVNITVSNQNRIPFIHFGSDYNPSGESNTPPNRINNIIDNHNGTITIDYTISPDIKNAYILVVDISSWNNEIAKVPCLPENSQISAHVPYGVYAVSLMINDRPYYTKKIYVSHHNY